MSENIINITSDIPTPFLLIDNGILKKNIQRIQAYADLHGFKVRPHVKTHKSLHIAQMQMEAGAVGIAVARVGEARVMAEHGNTDITVAYPIPGSHNADAVAGLARLHTVRVAVDSEYLMDSLSKAALRRHSVIGIHIMFDAGLHRCGLSDPSQVLTLARYAQKKPGLRYEGIQLYLGHLYGDAAVSPESFKRINALWNPVYDLLCKEGLPPETVSSGSTPSLFNTHRICHVNEIRVGTAFLNDYFVLKFDHCRLEDCAARIIATVISDKTAGQVIIDAGSKALSAKQLLRHETLEMGYIHEYPEARIFRLHEEHGWVDVSHCRNRPVIGDRLSIIPVNVALCMNLYDSFYLFSREELIQKKKVDARGYCQIGDSTTTTEHPDLG